MKLYIKHHFRCHGINCQLVQYYPAWLRIVFVNYTSEFKARQNKDRYTVGMWKVKKNKL